MSSSKDEFIALLEKENRGECVSYIIGKLSSGDIDIVSLYDEVLTPALNEPLCEGEERYCIWHEHVRSSIVRTAVESAYPYLRLEMDEKMVERLGKKVVVFCPPEEYHDIGARMASDLFELAGYDVVFVGANSPRGVILSAIEFERPDIVALSISNCYHFFETKRIIKELKETADYELKVVVGGSPFTESPEKFREVGADCTVTNFDDIIRLECD
jgi:methanogenic corrinoid protein MtbC1